MALAFYNKKDKKFLVSLFIRSLNAHSDGSIVNLSGRRKMNLCVMNRQGQDHSVVCAGLLYETLPTYAG